MTNQSLQYFRKEYLCFSPYQSNSSSNINCWNRKGERLSMRIAFGHNRIIGFVDEIHFFFFENVRNAFRLCQKRLFLGSLYKIFRCNSFEKMLFVSCLNLIFKSSEQPIQSNIRKRRLSPTYRHIQVVNKTSNRF